VGTATYTFNHSATISLGIPFTVYWTIQGTNVQFGVQATPKNQGWVALGFGRRMIGSHAVIATRLTSGDVRVNEFAMDSQDTAGVQVATTATTSNRAVDYASDGSVSFVFTLPASSVQTTLNSATPILAASGIAPSTLTALREHNVFTQASLTLNSSTGSTVTQPSSNLVLAHLVLMMVGWLGLIPLAALFGSTRFRQNWFKWDTKYLPKYTLPHRFAALLGVLIITVGFIVGKNLGHVGGSYKQTHETLGTVTFILMFGQVAFGVLRVATANVTSLARKMEEFKVGKAVITLIHQSFGYIVWILAVVTMFFGLLNYPTYGSDVWSIVILFMALGALVLFFPPIYAFVRRTCVDDDEEVGQQAQFTPHN
jgi:hypothetical protein